MLLEASNTTPRQGCGKGPVSPILPVFTSLFFFFFPLENVDLKLQCFSLTNTEGQTLPRLLEMNSE